jgi:hypothetical protein
MAIRLESTLRVVFNISLAAGMLYHASAGTIDFTPTEGQRQLEGIVFTQTLFHQDGRVITYETPREWSRWGNSSRLILTPPGTSRAQAIIEQVTLPGPQTFDDPATKQLQQIVLNSVPPDAHDVQLVSVEANPVRINHQASYEVKASYRYFGQNYQVGVIFANLGDLQLRFRFVARTSEFEELYRMFRGSLFTLHWS